MDRADKEMLRKLKNVVVGCVILSAIMITIILLLILLLYM